MKQNLKNILYRNAPTIVAGAIMTATVAFGFLEGHREKQRQLESELKQSQWEERIQELKDRECSNSVHYLNKEGYYMHGNFNEGLGWSEEYCPKYNVGVWE